MTETKALQYKPDLSPQNPNSWENGFNKCLGVKRLQVFHAFTNPNKLHWDSKFIHNANLQQTKQENPGETVTMAIFQFVYAT
jgi:hypothetical protein